MEIKKPEFIAPIPTGDKVLDDAIYIKHHRQYLKDLEIYNNSPMIKIEQMLVDDISKAINEQIIKDLLKLK